MSAVFYLLLESTKAEGECPFFIINKVLVTDSCRSLDLALAKWSLESVNQYADLYLFYCY
jgi:hypothetical protein